MNNVLKLCAAVALLAPCGIALADNTCLSPTNLNTAGASFSLPGNTCNGTAEATLLCSNFDYSQKKEIIYSFTLGAGFTATALTMTSIQQGYTPAMFVTSSACSAADTCDSNGTLPVKLKDFSVE